WKRHQQQETMVLPGGFIVRCSLQAYGSISLINNWWKERISEQEERLMQYFEDQKGKYLLTHDR
ncbi:hypothetical protein OS493_038992, partial [Desmophyllum pertusum]